MTYQFRENGTHYNGGAVFFGYGYAAIGEPRLGMVRKWYRQGDRRGKTEDSFHAYPVDTHGIYPYIQGVTRNGDKNEDRSATDKDYRSPDHQRLRREGVAIRDAFHPQ